MAITWDQEAKDRLLDAVIASVDNLNNRQIARFFGGEATVSAIENALRKHKQRAEALKVEAAAAAEAGHVIPATTPRKANTCKTGSPVKTPKKPAPSKAVTPIKTGGVKSGRVTKEKSTPRTPRTPISIKPTKDAMEIDSPTKIKKEQSLLDCDMFAAGSEEDI